MSESLLEDIQKAFNDSVEYVKTAPPQKEASQSLKLKMYALYKQATQGDVCGPKPGLMDIAGKAKYKAWSRLKGVSKEEAMQQYVDMVARASSGEYLSSE